MSYDVGQLQLRTARNRSLTDLLFESSFPLFW
jgi:hypothetical protein